MWLASLIISLTFMASPWQWPSVNNNISTIIFVLVHRTFIQHWSCPPILTILEKINRYNRHMRQYLYFTYVSYANYGCGYLCCLDAIKHGVVIVSPLEGVWCRPSRRVITCFCSLQINANRAFAFALFNTYQGNWIRNYTIFTSELTWCLWIKRYDNSE